MEVGDWGLGIGDWWGFGVTRRDTPEYAIPNRIRAT